MNKKQWYALGILFMGFAFGFTYIAFNIQDQTYVLLMWLSFMTSVACQICGWLEKEGAR